MTNDKTMIGCHGEGVMVRVSCALRKLIPGQSSREKRGGGSSCFRRQEKSSGLPDMQVIVIVFSGSLVYWSNLAEYDLII